MTTSTLTDQHYAILAELHHRDAGTSLPFLARKVSASEESVLVALRELRDATHSSPGIGEFSGLVEAGRNGESGALLFRLTHGGRVALVERKA